MRSVTLLVIVALVAAGSAEAKFSVSVRFAPQKPRVGQPVRVVIRAAETQDQNCRMRLVVVAPGVDRYYALDALIIGGRTIMGPTGPSFHRLRATPRLGFLAHTERSSSTTWRATVKFPRSGRWQLIVPNWCAPGYAGTPPAARVISVR